MDAVAQGGIVAVGDIVESNGKTIRENNMRIVHNLAVGDLVEVKYDKSSGNGACEKVHARLWIVECSRDCDGTPLYYLSHLPLAAMQDMKKMFNLSDDDVRLRMMCNVVGGFLEESLTPVSSSSRELVWDE